jgi:hypothetical protein
MTGSLLTAVLLADATLLGAGNLGRASRPENRAGGSEALFWMLVAGGAIAVVCVAIRVASRMQHRRRYNSHASLFRALCRLHGLDRRARRLLRQVARRRKLPHPARLFTEPHWLDPSGLPRGLRRRAAEIAFLRNRLFA